MGGTSSPLPVGISFIFRLGPAFGCGSPADQSVEPAGDREADIAAIEENITCEEVGVSGDWAFIRTSYRMTSTPRAGGESIPASGKAIWLFRRQADGSWKGSHCIWNANE